MVKRCRRFNICLSKKGFTLIELFIALSVLAIISVASVSYYQDYVEDAKMTVRKTNEKLVNDAIKRYYKEHMVYPRYDWEQDSINDVKNNVYKGLDSLLSGYFVNKNVSEIFSEGSNAGGYEVYFRVTEPRKKGSDNGNIDNSSDAGTWKMSKNLRVATKDYLVNEIRIIPKDEVFPTNTFNSLETFNFPIIDNSVPIRNDSTGYNTIEPDEELDIQMVCCPPGIFKMGANPGELGGRQNENQHTVTLTKQFLISKYEITQKQYLEIMGSNPSQFKEDFFPVTNVNRQDAINFCEKLNTNFARLVPYGYKFDLPTEAQWEYACRAGTTTSLNNGTNITSAKGSCNNLNNVGWYKQNSKVNNQNRPHPVGEKDPNNWGIYDMHGNAEELIKDLRNVVGGVYEKYPGDEVDPCVESGNEQCYRGGGYSIDAERCRSASRQGSGKNNKPATVGFRVVLVPIDE